MADFADEGQAMEELALQQALALHRRAMAERKVIPTGACHNCEEPLTPVNGQNVQLFCDVHCSQDWELRTKKRN